MKRSNKLDFFPRKLSPAGLSRGPSLGHIARPTLNLSSIEVRKKADDDHKLRSRGVTRTLSVGLIQPPVDILHPVYVKPEGAPLFHRLSLDGNPSAAVYLPQHTGPVSKIPTHRVYNSPLVSSSRDILNLTRSQLPTNPTSNIDMRRHISGGSEPLPHLNSPAPGIQRKEQSRQTKHRIHDSESTNIMTRAVAKFSFRTRVGSVNGVPKPHNQDSYIIFPDFEGCKNQFLLGVYDGHGRW